MKTTLELAARALCELDSHPENATMGGKPLWMDYLPEARAVLRAIREPGPTLTEAGAEVVRNVGQAAGDAALASDAANTWRFMIDAALAERP